MARVAVLGNPFLDEFVLAAFGLSDDAAGDVSPDHVLEGTALFQDFLGPWADAAVFIVQRHQAVVASPSVSVAEQIDAGPTGVPS